MKTLLNRFLPFTVTTKSAANKLAADHNSELSALQYQVELKNRKIADLQGVIKDIIVVLKRRDHV